ncbi:YrhB domain-containing protein [Tropicibacter sp. S64]|uniref:YrhB domain-containing protein n=1 Tax=Tropicibacter sp. S64 TaxID=3415122 RepID=UPI003C7E97D2
MLTLEEARALAEAFIADWDGDLVLIPEPVASGDFGWVFVFRSRQFLRSGALSDALAGNGPLLVDRHRATLTQLGTAHSVGYFVDAYLRDVAGREEMDT